MRVLHLLVRGGNHLLIEGPRLNYQTAWVLMGRLEMPLIGEENPLSSEHRIVTKAWREQIGVAMVFPCPEPQSPAVEALLGELSERGVPIERH